MLGPDQPITVPATHARRLLKGGYKSKVTLSLSSGNPIRFRFGSHKPTLTSGSLLALGEKIIIEDINNDLVGELWAICTNGSAVVDVDVT